MATKTRAKTGRRTLRAWDVFEKECGNSATIYGGAQNAVDKSGAIVGKGDIGLQTEKALENLQIPLSAGGATLQNVVKWSVYILAGQ